jgi:hypothetical protein
MKYVVIEYADSVNISAASIDTAANVVIVAPAATISGGKVVFTGQGQNPSATVLPHTHPVPAGSGTVNIPAGATGQPT